MLMKTAREQIVSYGNRLIEDGLTVGTAGNISVYDPESGYMAISPSGIPYADTLPEDIVIMDLHGNILEGDRKPSSESALHSAFYLADIGAQAVVHAHSMYCTTLACMGEPGRTAALRTLRHCGSRDRHPSSGALSYLRDAGACPGSRRSTEGRREGRDSGKPRYVRQRQFSKECLRSCPDHGVVR